MKAIIGVVLIISIYMDFVHGKCDIPLLKMCALYIVCCIIKS